MGDDSHLHQPVVDIRHNLSYLTPSFDMVEIQSMLRNLHIDISTDDDELMYRPALETRQRNRMTGRRVAMTTTRGLRKSVHYEYYIRTMSLHLRHR